MLHRKITFAVAALALMGMGASDAQAGKLNEFLVVNGDSIPEYLSGQPGDPKNGRKLLVAKKKGNCLSCHAAPIPEQADHGEIGPTLEGVADRMTEGQLRMRLVDPKIVNEDTMMPAYYRVDGLHRVNKKFIGKPLLKEQEIEDIVAYLTTLTE